MPSNHLILCHLLLLPSVFPRIRVFSNESALRIRRPQNWSCSFNISPSNEHPGLISFRMDWLDLLAVQGTLKSLLQHHSSKASILWCSAFFMVQLSKCHHLRRPSMITLTNTVSPPPLLLLWDSCPLTVRLWGPRGPPVAPAQRRCAAEVCRGDLNPAPCDS